MPGKIFVKRSFYFLLVSVLLIYLAIPLPYPLFSPDYSTVILDKNNQILRSFLNQNEQWCFPPQPELPISDKLISAVLNYEDRYFYYHPGLNPIAILRALYQNMTSNKRISGASTITMQLARLMRPKQRNYRNKIFEILQALKIELHYSKPEILASYLNHAPYGGNIIGYQAASLRYFQKIPDQLTWGEAAVLAVLPNAPGLISPSRNKQRLKRKRDHLLTKLFDQNVIDKKSLELALIEPLPQGTKPAKMLAPHLGQHLKNKYGKTGGLISTTINLNHQQRIKELVSQHSRYLKPLGIRNATVLVAETQTGNIAAYIGSQDFFDTAAQGQVDGVMARRSSGSLLKPFLYALCMDEGIILPETLVKDVPTYYGAFSPHNATGKYNGILPAKEALVSSLNVPAARLLFTYGIHPFYQFLKSTHISSLFRPPDDYGLPLVLGGAEVTAWDMTTLFRGLANGGKFEPLHLLKTETRPSLNGGSAISSISPMACYLTLNMLRKLRRPGSEYYWEQYQSQQPIAWKTGTSFGQRDAWAVGVSPQWIISVWVGNFTGESNSNLGGAKCAGPLLFDVFNYLPKDPQNPWFKEPQDDSQQLELCLDTGFLAGDNCPQTSRTKAPRFMKPLRICPYHQKIYISNSHHYQVCSVCWKPGNYHSRKALVLPPDVVQNMQEHGQRISDIPGHNPDCPVQTSETPLEILYPQQNALLWVPRDFGGITQKVTMSVAHRDHQRQLFWYLDDHYLGSTKNRHQKPVGLSKGWHILEVVDEAGFRDRTRFFVEMK